MEEEYRREWIKEMKEDCREMEKDLGGGRMWAGRGRRKEQQPGHVLSDFTLGVPNIPPQDEKKTSPT